MSKPAQKCEFFWKNCLLLKWPTFSLTFILVVNLERSRFPAKKFYNIDYWGKCRSRSVWPEKIAKCLSKLPKMISLKEWKIWTPLQKLPTNVGDWDKLIVAKGFKKLPKVQ